VSCGNRINRHLRNRRDGPDSGVISSIFMRMPYNVVRPNEKVLENHAFETAPRDPIDHRLAESTHS